MTEERLEAINRIKAERYQIHQVPLTAGPDVSSYATLQEAVNKGARQSWRLVGVTQDPVSQGVLIVWDTSTSAFISG